MKRFLTVISSILLLGFAANAQWDDDAVFGGDLWDDSSSEPAEPPAQSAPASSWDYADEPEPPPARPAKPAKEPRAPKEPKVKQPKPERAPRAAVSASDGTLNAFAGLGWGFGFGGHYAGALEKYREHEASSTNSLSSDEDYYINFGEGFKFEFGAGWMAAPSLEARFSVDINFGLFAPTTGKEYNTAASDGTGVRKIETVNKYHSWGIKAMAVPQFEMLELFDAYVGAGLRLSFAGASYEYTLEYHSADTRAPVKQEYTREFSPSLGFCGVVGAIIPFNDAMSFFGEIQFDAKNFRLNKDRLEDWSPKNTSPTDKVYEKDATDRDAPIYYPGSNWSIRAGIKYWVM